jgi:diacylglycerol O-acyltransferase
MEVLQSRLGPTDAFTVALERDPMLRSTIVAVALFDTAPDHDVLADRIERATRLIPSFRQRLTPTPLGLAPPRFRVDPDFDLDFHFRTVAAPEPRTFATVLEMARNASMAAFDPARPLWQFTLVEGLTDARAALIMKVHHALTDGIGGVQLAAHLVDLQREPPDMGPMPLLPPAGTSGPLDAWRDAIAFDLNHAFGAAAAWLTALPANAAGAIRSPLASAVNAADVSASLLRFVRPVTKTLSPVMQDRGLSRHCSTLDVPLESLRQAAKLIDGSINDGFIAGITGGMRRYHERHLSHVESLRLTMPISLRKSGDPEGGNRITLMRFEVPISIDDPIERMRDLDARCNELRHDRAIPWSDTVAGVLQLLPSSITGGMLKHVDFLASNVPGFTLPVFAGGARMIGFYPFAPTLGSAANITLMSYCATCHIGINTDADAVPDPDLFLDCLREGFEEVLAVIGEHDEVRIGVD